MIIREEAPNDRPQISQVVQAAFGRMAEAHLVEQLRAEGDSVIALVAVEQSQIIGHVMLSNMAAPFKALGLGPVSVRPDRQRSGVGSALIREGLGQAREDGWHAVFVLGDPAFYRRFGFDPELAGGFTCPYAGPHLMVLCMSNDLPRSGTIDYASAFAVLL
jgi:putative acetyltransferase